MKGSRKGKTKGLTKGPKPAISLLADNSISSLPSNTIRDRGDITENKGAANKEETSAKLRRGRSAIIRDIRATQRCLTILIDELEGLEQAA